VIDQTVTAPVSRPARRGRRQLSPRWRKVMLTLHVAVSVGWLGSAYGMVVLGLVAWSNTDPLVRWGAYVALHDSDRLIMIPGSLAALATGLIVSLFTPWGLVKHFWVLTKLTLTVSAMIFAALYVSQKATRAMQLTGHGAHVSVGSLGGQVVLGSVVMVLILAANTALSVFKPWGRTRRRRTPQPRIC
jgi:hypothetical protein